MNKVLTATCILIFGTSTVLLSADAKSPAEAGMLVENGMVTVAPGSDSDTLAASSSAPERLEQIRRRIDEIRSTQLRRTDHIPHLTPPVFQSPHHADAVDNDRIERLEYLIRLLETTDIPETLTWEQVVVTMPSGVTVPMDDRDIPHRDTNGVERDWPAESADTVYITITDTVFVTTTDTVYADRIQTEIIELQQILETAIFRAFSVVFEFDSHNLLPSSFRILDEVGKLLIDNPDIIIEVQGHTDNVGPRDYNLALSNRRAESVKTYILDQFPELGRERINTAGFGPDRPLMPNENPTQRALNRRVEFVIPDL